MWRGLDIVTSVEMAVASGLIHPDERSALSNWFTDLMWPTGPDALTPAARFQNALPDYVRIALVAAILLLSSLDSPLHGLRPHNAHVLETRPRLKTRATTTTRHGGAPLPAIAGCAASPPPTARP
jgi:hypothetical protein